MQSRTIPGVVLCAIVLTILMASTPGCDREPATGGETCKEAGNHYVALFNDSKEVHEHYPNPKMAAWTMRRNIIQRCTRGRLNPRCILANRQFVEAHRCLH